MARDRKAAGGAGGREPTLTERARRAQLIEVTIELVADKGYAGTSLAGIAERAGITKAAVLYHFPSKDALVSAAHEHVLDALVGEVAAAVEAAGAADGPAAYIRAMIGHLRAHPRHTRMIVEAMTHGHGDHAPEARWRPLAEIIAAARHARGTDERTTRTSAIVLGGAINAIVAERLHDPGYDTEAAAEELIRSLDPGFAGRNAAAARLDAPPAGFGAPVPVLRIHDETVAREFYLDYLGFGVQWEHRFEPGLPLYLRIHRDAALLDLSEHHGDGTPGTVVWIPIDDAAAFHAEISRRPHPRLRPGIDREAPGGPTIEITDPFGNVLRFCEPTG